MNTEFGIAHVGLAEPTLPTDVRNFVVICVAGSYSPPYVLYLTAVPFVYMDT